MSTHCLRLLCTLATLATALATDAVELSEHPCWLGCHRAIEIIATPIYYIGMAFYYLLYPVIYLVEWWRWFSTAATASGTAAAEATGSFLTWIIMFIPNLILSKLRPFLSLYDHWLDIVLHVLRPFSSSIVDCDWMQSDDVKIE